MMVCKTKTHCSRVSKRSQVSLIQDSGIGVLDSRRLLIRSTVVSQDRRVDSICEASRTRGRVGSDPFRAWITSVMRATSDETNATHNSSQHLD